MSKRGFTLPPAATQSAKQARSAFFCSLCQKGYSRMNEFEAHESSYDHQHKKRLKEMKEMQRQVVQQQPKKEDKGAPLMTIKLGGAAGNTNDGGGGGGGGFKRGGFKNAFVPVAGEEEAAARATEAETKKVMHDEVEKRTEMPNEADLIDSDVTDDEDYYDPLKPTGCMPGCTSQVATGVV